MKILGNTGLHKLIELIRDTINAKTTAISDTNIGTAWGSNDPLDSYVENSVSSLTAAEIAAQWNSATALEESNPVVNDDLTVTGNLNVDGELIVNDKQVAVFNQSGQLTFPDGTKIWIENTENV